MENYYKLLIISFLALFSLSPLWAKTIEVDSAQKFKNAMAAAVEGDTILWMSGEYSDVEMLITKSKITVRAKIIGQTIFTGGSRVDILGNNIVFEGFQFLDGVVEKKNVIDVKGSFNRISEINISGYTSWKYLVIKEKSTGNIVTHCNFENRLNLDDKNILSILVDENKPGKHKVQYCSFKNFDGGGKDMGIEPVRIGVSTQKEFSSQSVIEYCYFTQCNGDGEIISNKAADNVIRYNTFEDNPISEVVLRHGDGANVYGNFFLNGKGGVRVKEGKNHSIYNNYFSGLTGASIYLQNTKVDPVRGTTIAHNTFVNTAKIRLNGKGDHPPRGTVLFNNLLYNQKLNSFSEATGLEQWRGNYYYGKTGLKATNGLDKIEPLLEENKFGFQQISFRSPVINKSASGMPPIPAVDGMGVDNKILLDITKTTRPIEEGKKDVGCYEFFISTKVKPHATKENTGPSYKLGNVSLGKAKKAIAAQKSAPISKLDSLRLREQEIKAALKNVSSEK